MKHTGYSYKILSSLEELQGKTIIEVYTAFNSVKDNEEFSGMCYIITNATIALLQGDFCHRFDSLSEEEVLDFESHTGIKRSQILEQ